MTVSDIDYSQVWTMPEEALLWMSLIVALAIGFMFAIPGATKYLRTSALISGLAWMFAALPVYSRIDVGFGVIAFGFGIMLFILGGMGWIGGTNDLQ